VLTVTALTDGEYLLSSVALGIDEYYAGVGEAPGVWSGAWSSELGVEGMVEADQLRALIDGVHPGTGEPVLVGLRDRSVKAFDLTVSAPKSVSLLWALGSEAVADTVMAAHREAVEAALGFLEARAATARMQVDGVRRHVPTHGWAVAGFVHRTSREGDPQLHTHCLIPNVVCREPDGRYVALAARPAKDHCLTPALLAGRWHAEAAAVGLDVGRALDRVVCWRDPSLPALGYDAIVDALVDEETGLCAHIPRFDEPDVIEHVAALSAGRLTVDEIRDVTTRFLDSDLVVRLVPSRAASGWEPARWSTTIHRALEDDTLALLDVLQDRPGWPITATNPTVGLGADQQHAVSVWCGEGGGVRAVLAPAGYGKTAMVHAAACAAVVDGRPVVAVATTAKAVAELTDAGLPAVTVARFRLDIEERPLAPGTVVVLDEVSQSSTRNVHTILGAVAACPGGQL
jgi:hypothetical protein